MSDYRFNNPRSDGSRGGGFGRRDYGRRSFGGSRDGGRRTMHQATCAECGNKCEIPFVPRDDRPIYCSNCFEKRGNSNPNPRRFDRNTSFNSNAVNSELKDKLVKIESKIDKLLNLLAPIAESEMDHEEKELEKELSEEKTVKTAKRPAVKKKERDLIV